MDSFPIGQVELIILAGAVVAMVTRRLKIPYTVGLVAAGFILAILNVQLGVTFSRDLVFNVLLPPLVFEASLYIRWSELKRDLWVIAIFATLGVLISALITGGFMYFAAGWAAGPAVLFAVLIAATDPVAVIATMKEVKVRGRLRLLVEAESLFNDGTAAVIFAAALLLAGGETPGAVSFVWMLISSIIGGVICGVLVGGAAVLLIGRTKDNLVELSMTSVAAFGSFWLAEYFHMSGILAATAAGVLIGNLKSSGYLTEKGENSVEYFWDFAAFVANSAIFLLLGVTAAYQNIGSVLVPVLVAIFAVLLGRAGAVYACAALIMGSARRIRFSHQHILVWGGLRGALALALSLGIPETYAYRQEVITVTFAVVAFSVVAQGTSIAWLLRWLEHRGSSRTQGAGDITG